MWDPRIAALYWVDIVEGLLYESRADCDEVSIHDVGSQLGCVGLTVDPQILVCGTRAGWTLLDTSTSKQTPLCDPEADRPSCRFNDGGVDRAGRFWTGSLEDAEVDPVGRLYRLDVDGSFTVADEGFVCSNGLGWSPDQSTMYFVDSRRDVIHRYCFDAEQGTLGERSVFVDTTDLPGMPDGLRVDSMGDVWCAFWDGARVVRFAPDGEIRAIVALPVPRPTSIAFGGTDLRTAYVTSASLGLDAAQLEQWPLSGSVLQFDIDVAGSAANYFQLERANPQ